LCVPCRGGVVLSSAPISVENGIGPLLASVADRDETRCAELAELPGAFVCCSRNKALMNRAFSRMSIFMGGLAKWPHGSLPADGSPIVKWARDAVQGNNLPGRVLIDFAAKQTRPTRAEQEVLDVFGKVAKTRGENFYVIAIASGAAVAPYKVAVSHEILHAQYLLSPGMKPIVDRFWKETMTGDERREIYSLLKGSYNVDDDAILIDETQAFLLMDGAENFQLRKFALGDAGRRDLRSLLLRGLEAARITPLQVLQ